MNNTELVEKLIAVVEKSRTQPETAKRIVWELRNFSENPPKSPHLRHAKLFNILTVGVSYPEAVHFLLSAIVE